MATSFSVMTILPRWTVPSAQPLEPGSRDPLGFQRYAARFADSILPKLTVLTTRARYYAFLAWTLDEIALATEPRFLVGEALPFEEYTETVARFERFLALSEAAWHSTHENTCSWIGKRRSKALVKGKRANLPLDVPLTVREGAHGVLANYRLSMQSIGLLSEVPGPLPDLLTDEGRELADKFRRAVQIAKANRARDLCLDLSQRSVSIRKLEDIGKRICLSEIKDDERAFLSPRLLGGDHEAVVAELRSILKRKLESINEPEILTIYLHSDARHGIAFELKQIAVYQAFAFACLGLFKGLRAAFEEIGQERRLDEILAAQLEHEGIQLSSTLDTLTRQVEGLEEIVSLHNQPGDWLKESAEWIRPSLRLLAWLARRVEAEPALVFSETVDSVSLRDVADLMRLTDRQVDRVLEMLCERLVSDHQRVFISKRKMPWFSLSGSRLRLEDAVDLPLYFPPNSVRLNSLISIFRDLEVRHG